MAVVCLAVALLLLATPASAQEAIGVQGGGTPRDAPRLEEGLYLDLIGEPETLWYALSAQEGQRVAATVVVRGRPDGPASESSEITAELLDSQRQTSGQAATATFSGNADARVEVVGDPLPATEEGVAYLTVTLASPTGANDLRDVGYQLEFSVAVSGSPSPSEPPATVDPEPEPEQQPVPATPPPAASGPAASDYLPVALVGFAVGGVTGFEGMRARLRRRR